jgi:hypothetical protein
MKDKNIGIYFLANDVVLDQTIGLLNSLRHYEPDVNLTLIPFNENIDGLRALSGTYKFDIWNEPSLKELEDFGQTIFPTHPIAKNTFKKFAAFWGKYEHFMFLDTDIVVIDKLSPLIERFIQTGSEFIYSDPFLEQSYQKGAFLEKMIIEYDAKGFCTGSFISSNRLLSKKKILELLQQSVEVNLHFADERTYEQPYLNYCIDVAKIKKTAVSELLPEVSDHNYAINMTYRKIGPEFQLITVKDSDRTSSSDKKKRLWVHWASAGAGFFMVNRHLFLHYRLLNEPLWKKIRYLVQFTVKMKGLGIGGKIKLWISKVFKR